MTGFRVLEPSPGGRLTLEHESPRGSLTQGPDFPVERPILLLEADPPPPPVGSPPFLPSKILTLYGFFLDAKTFFSGALN
jgi:hypothetical protein